MTYDISEPDLFPKCSPVSIPKAPAPCPKPTPFGLTNKNKIVVFVYSSFILTQIYERNIVYKISCLHVQQLLLIQAFSCINLFDK